MNFISIFGDLIRLASYAVRFFRRAAHKSTAMQSKMNIYHRFPRHNPLFSINSYPHGAGNSFPAVLRKSGSRSEGNMMPESMIDGKKNKLRRHRQLCLIFYKQSQNASDAE